MATVLKQKDEEVYLKSYDGVTGDIQFTDDGLEAKTYQNEWFAKTELDYLMFHFPEYNDEHLKKMIVYCT